MSQGWDGIALVEPLPGENPCGRALDDSLLLAFDAHRVFAQQVALDAPLDKDEQGRTREQGRTPKPVNSPEWLEIRDKASAALSTSKDLRVLALLGAALLRTDGLSAYCEIVVLASRWLRDYWDTVYPVAKEDALERQSALSCLGDQFGVVDMIRRAPLVTSRQHGQFSLKEIEQAKALGPVDAAFDELSLESLQGFRQSVAAALGAFGEIDARIREADPEAVLSFESASGQLTNVARVLATQLGRRQGTSEPEAEGVASAGGVLGPIKTRQDAIRALDAVAAFFQQTEPSSPVPLLLDRAKRLVSKTFLEVLADIAPGALGEARVASGVKSE